MRTEVPSPRRSSSKGRYPPQEPCSIARKQLHRLPSFHEPTLTAAQADDLIRREKSGLSPFLPDAAESGTCSVRKTNRRSGTIVALRPECGEPRPESPKSASRPATPDRPCGLVRRYPTHTSRRERREGRLSKTPASTYPQWVHHGSFVRGTSGSCTTTVDDMLAFFNV